MKGRAVTTAASRRIVFTIAPAIVVAGALAGCGDSAPSVQAPPSTAKTTSATGAPTKSGTSTEVPTASGVPTVSDAPSSSTPDPAKVCDSTADDDSTPIKGGVHTKKVAWGKPQAFDRATQGKVSVTAAKPTALKATKKDDVFGPKAGQVYLSIKVTVKYESGKASTVNDVFVLKDAKKNLCDAASSVQDAVPAQQVFDSSTVSKKTPTYSGTLLFSVPKGQDYTKYTLRYLVDDYDPSTTDTVLTWSK